MNWLMFSTGLMQFSAGIWSFVHGDWRLGCCNCLVGVGTTILAGARG